MQVVVPSIDVVEDLAEELSNDRLEEVVFVQQIQMVGEDLGEACAWQGVALVLGIGSGACTLLRRRPTSVSPKRPSWEVGREYERRRFANPTSSFKALLQDEVPGSSRLEDCRHDDFVDVRVDVLQEGRVDLKDDHLEIMKENRHRVVIIFIAFLTQIPEVRERVRQDVR